ncbi:hypothetical protein IFR05_004433 [Cadophora sp. M221]|nr:hypothetical protein IFR05_004433 [Cadophora sp. M221]
MADPTLDGPGIIYVTSKIVRTDVLDEETYIKWYEEDHIPDILDKTPIASAHRFSNVVPKANRPYLLMYPMEDLAAIHGEGFKKLKVNSDFMPENGAPYDYADLDFRDYKLIQKYDPNEVSEGKSKFIATGGFELDLTLTAQDLHDWYNQEHLERLAKVPGYLRTTRYRLMHHSTNADTRVMLGLAAKDELPAQEEDEPPTWHAIHEFDEGFNKDSLGETIDTEWTKKIFKGILGQNTIFSWFSTSFTVPSSWSGRQVLLNFAAVDYEATVYINGNQVGFNRGGYFCFTIDATEHVTFNGTNELLVFVHDPVDSEGSVITTGKQTLRRSHIFYTPCSGIWQSVWIEAAPDIHITQFDVAANMDGKVNVTVHSSSGSQNLVEVTLDGLSFTGKSDIPFQFAIESPNLWSQDSPTLYNFTVKLGDDEVKSYTGFRTISKAEVNGIVSPILKRKPIFMFGTLDQGFWPDGIYTAPNREAMVYDLEIKVDPALFYQACDQLGLLVIQDMPSLRADGVLSDEAQQAEFTRQLEILVNQHKSYPSIATYLNTTFILIPEFRKLTVYFQIIYNEGWGQLRDGVYPEFGLTDLVRSIDSTRLIDSTLRWFDYGAGDFSDNHYYANPQCGTPFYSINSSPFDPTRIGFQGEFGGIIQNDLIEQGHFLLNELKEQTRMYSCNGGVWTQTTDVEGEVNGLLTYDRRVLRPDEEQWRKDVQALYYAAAGRGNGSYPIH